MIYSDSIGEIFKIIGIPALVSIIVTAYAKNKYDIKLEKIKVENSIILSSFQSEIANLKSKENIKFAKLHEKRFEVLAKIYEHINYAIVATHNSISPIKNVKGGTFEESEKHLLSEFKEVFFAFSEYYSLNRIYLNLETTILIDKYFLQSLLLTSEYESSKANDIGSVYSKMNEIIVPIKNEIEEKFRLILGE